MNLKIIVLRERGKIERKNILFDSIYRKLLNWQITYRNRKKIEFCLGIMEAGQNEQKKIITKEHREIFEMMYMLIIDGEMVL